MMCADRKNEFIKLASKTGSGKYCDKAFKKELHNFEIKFGVLDEEYLIDPNDLSEECANKTMAVLKLPVYSREALCHLQRITGKRDAVSSDVAGFIVMLMMLLTIVAMFAYLFAVAIGVA